MVKDGIPDFRVRPPGHGGHPLQACPVPGPPGVGGYIGNILIIIFNHVLNVPLDELARHVTSNEEASGSIPGVNIFFFLPLKNACLVPKSPTDRRQSRRQQTEYECDTDQ